MSSVLPPRRPIILKASRDTLMLLAAAGAMTFAIAYSVHNRPVALEQSTQQAMSGDWAGQLAELSPPQSVMPAPSEPLSSEALTVPKAAMALPIVPKPPVSAKPRACDGTPCTPSTRATAAVAPPRRVTAAVSSPRVREASLVEKLNPLNHLPAAVARPFASAGDTIAAWVRRF